jgi:hypothetical protein
LKLCEVQPRCARLATRFDEAAGEYRLEYLASQHMDRSFAGSMVVDTLGPDAIWGKLHFFSRSILMAAETCRALSNGSSV